jgi:hypothetical protein
MPLSRENAIFVYHADRRRPAMTDCIAEFLKCLPPKGKAFYAAVALGYEPKTGTMIALLEMGAAYFTGGAT